MWWSDDIVRRWGERVLVSAFMLISGTFVALIASLFVGFIAGAPIASMVPDRLGAWMFWHYSEIVYTVKDQCTTFSAEVGVDDVMAAIRAARAALRSIAEERPVTGIGVGGHARSADAGGRGGEGPAQRQPRGRAGGVLATRQTHHGHDDARVLDLRKRTLEAERVLLGE